MEEIDEALECLNGWFKRFENVASIVGFYDVEVQPQVAAELYTSLRGVLFKAQHIIYAWGETEFNDGPQHTRQDLPPLQEIRDCIEECRAWFEAYEGPSSKSATKV